MTQLDMAVQLSERMQSTKTFDELDAIFDEVAFNDEVSEYGDWLYLEKQGNELRIKSELKNVDILKEKNEQ